jgi:hypothetical protein
MAKFWVNNVYVPEAQDFLLTLKCYFISQSVGASVSNKENTYRCLRRLAYVIIIGLMY